MRKNGYKRIFAILLAFVFLLSSAAIALADTVYVGKVGFDMDKMLNDDAYKASFNEYYGSHANDTFLVDMAGMIFDVDGYLNAPEGTSMAQYAQDTPATIPGDAFIWPGDADKTALAAKIEEAQGLNEAEYTVDSFAALTQALTGAIAVNDNSVAIQVEVDAALQALTTAIEGLIPVNAVTVASVTATNGTVDVTLNAAPAEQPVAEDFAFTYAIDEAEAQALTVADFNWNADTLTASFTFEAIEAAEAAQSVVVSASYDELNVVAAEPFTVDAASVIAVESLSSVNTTSVEVTFAAGTEVSEENLTGTTITLTAGEITLTATYKANSLADGKATYELGGEDALVDATTYTASAEGMSFTTADFVARVADAYAKDFAAVTTEVIAKTYAAAVGNQLESGVTKVYFSAKNQYDEEFALTADNSAITVTAKLNGVPLLNNTEVEYTGGNDYIEINKSLAVGNTLSITVTNKVGEVNYSKTFSYTVVEGAAAVETAVSNMVATYNAAQNNHTSGAVATEVMPDDEITLTVSVKDQYNNPMPDADVDVRWVIEQGTNLIADDDDVHFIDNELFDGDATITFKATSPGAIKITAYIANGQSASYEVMIGAKALTGLTVSPDEANNKYNHEEFIYSQITPSDGAMLNPEDLKFNIVATATSDDTVTADDVTVSASLRGGDTNEDDVVIKITSNKVGTFTITPYVGDAFDAQGVIKASAFNVTTVPNPAVASIEVEAIATNEMTAGTELIKAVTFKNQYDEMVDVDQEDLSIAATSNMTVKKYQDDEGTPADTNGEKVAYLGFKGTAAGTDIVTIVAGAVSERLSLTTVAASAPTSMELGSSTVSVIIADSKDAATPADDDMIAITDGLTYKLIPVTFKDQYGNVINVNANQIVIDVAGNATKPDVQLWGATADGTRALAVNAATPVKYLAVKAVAGNTSQTLTLQLKKQAGTNIGNALTLGVTVQDSRALNTLSVEPASGNAVVNAEKTFKLSGVDQYGAKWDINETPSHVKLVSQNGLILANQTASGDNDVTFTLSASAAGTYNAVVYLDGSGNSSKDTDEKSISIPFTVAEIGDAVASLEIQPTVNVTPNGVPAYDVNLETYKAQITEGNVASTYDFAVKAFDASENEVALSTGDVIYSVVSKTVAEGATAFTASINANTGVLTVTPSADGIISGTVVVKAATLNGVADTMTITLDSSEEAPQTGTYYLADASATDTALTEITLDADDTNGAQEVVLVALNQFGQEENITENDSTVVIGQDSSAYFNKAADADSINLVAKAPGTTNLRIFVNGNQEIVVPVTVTRDAAAAVPIALSNVTMTSADGTVTAVINGNNGTGTITLNIPAAPVRYTANFTTGTATLSKNVTATLNAVEDEYDIVTAVPVTTNMNVLQLVLTLFSDNGNAGVSIAKLVLNSGSTLTLTDAYGNIMVYTINVAQA